ncbi:RHS repeat-associated core domain-containing protein [Microbulbifer sp. SH-1]|uniref:RHS repeat-associated core domain-containing protein n=1 Tax=Microbulbifer sp. SH-1 TaxID=2681547 RepID=UPI001F10BB7A|nr:RHS repeat-associated core domain-containing protein [Microbulbifer sp. SH-1]
MTDPRSTGKSGKGVDTLFDRDAFGRLLQETTPDGITTFRYNRAGQMTEAENTHRKLRWQYDAAGRLIGDWQGNAEIRHEYDAAGNRIASLLPNGEKLRIGYNAAGQFQSLHRTPAGEEVEQLLAEISRDELGRETQRLHGNGLATESQYDPQGRLQKMRLGKSSGPVENPLSGQPLLERAYGYNRSGQLSQIDDSLRGTRKYHYDALDRLTQVEGPNPEHFIHDPAHNILAAAATPEEAKQQASATQVTGNRLKFRGDTHYEYDIHGNRIAALRGKGKKLQTRYRYNSKHQLIAVAQYRMDDTGEAQLQRETQYQYDPLGRRITKSDADKRIEFLWDGDVLLQERAAQAGSTDTEKTRTYYFEPGTFKPLALSENDEIYHYHLDHLGTPDTLTNGSGEVAWSVSYKSYGNLAVAHCNEVEQPIRFQGQYFDEESGLHYNRFRFFDPECGQFTQQDPIGLLGGGNNYQYVPNPAGWIDPLGLKCKEVWDVDAQRWRNEKGQFIKKSKVATDPDTAFFWSGRTDGVGGQDVAWEIAEQKGGVTLEMILENRGVSMPNWDPTNPSSIKAWENISEQYAANVSGEVRAVVGKNMRPGNIWENKELPALMGNVNVTKITTVDPKTLKETVVFER